MKTALQAVRKEAGFASARAFADYLGMSGGTYTAYEQARHAMPVDVACKLADALGVAMGRHVSLDEIVGTDGRAFGSKDGLSDNERDVLSLYRSMNDLGRRTTMRILRALVESEELTSPYVTSKP